MQSTFVLIIKVFVSFKFEIARNLSLGFESGTGHSFSCG